MVFIFGLGNPGLKYRNTRHNAGFLAIDELAGRHGVKLKSTKFEALAGQCDINGQRMMLVKPMTYMNHSGFAVSAVLDYYDADPSQLIVLYDDIDLPLGILRIREKGSAGTHNGMKSIISYLETEEFARVRMGIGKPNISLTGYVLGRFPKEEKAAVEEMTARAADAVECLVTDGIQTAQERFQKPLEKEEKR